MLVIRRTEEQLDLRFHSHGRPPMAYHPRYRTLLLARSPSGRHGSFLDSAEDYRFVRQLEREGRVVPAVGDFAGPRALRAIGQFLRPGETVGVYVSNVEFYLLRDDLRPLSPTQALPGRDSIFIRSCFDWRPTHGGAGRGATPRCSSASRAAGPAPVGRLPGYWDVCTCLSATGQRCEMTRPAAGAGKTASPTGPPGSTF
jgi:hypothetical protein